MAAVQVLEDDPLFNAGRGAVIAANGICELDASLMDGRDLRAGAVTGVRHVRSPIDLARLVMEQSPHVMLAGPGAEEFALEHGLEPVPNRYFVDRAQAAGARRRAARHGGQWTRATDRAPWAPSRSTPAATSRRQRPPAA